MSNPLQNNSGFLVSKWLDILKLQCPHSSAILEMWLPSDSAFVKFKPALLANSG